MRSHTLFATTVLVLVTDVLGATISSNARCGKVYGGTTCASRRDGGVSCCSSYGWCGSTDDHCLVSKGCQSAFGSCTPTYKTSAVKISPDGSCGGKKGYTCLGSNFGDCCSQYGWCGRTSAYCATGCNKLFGNCHKEASNTPRPSRAAAYATKSSPPAKSTTSCSTKRYSTKASSANGVHPTSSGRVSSNSRSAPASPSSHHVGPSSNVHTSSCSKSTTTSAKPPPSSSCTKTPSASASSNTSTKSSIISYGSGSISSSGNTVGQSTIVTPSTTVSSSTSRCSTASVSTESSVTETTAQMTSLPSGSVTTASATIDISSGVSSSTSPVASGTSTTSSDVLDPTSSDSSTIIIETPTPISSEISVTSDVMTSTDEVSATSDPVTSTLSAISTSTTELVTSTSTEFSTSDSAIPTSTDDPTSTTSVIPITSDIPASSSSDTTTLIVSPEPTSSVDTPSTSSELQPETSSSSASPTPTPTPVQLVANAGFEDATQAPWVLFPGGYEFFNTGESQYGLKTPRVARRGGLFASIRQVPIIPAGDYQIQFDIKVEGSNPSACFIQLTGVAEFDYGRAVDGSWHTYTYSLTSGGSNNEFIRIVVSCDTTSQSGFVYFDNIYINSA